MNVFDDEECQVAALCNPRFKARWMTNSERGENECRAKALLKKYLLKYNQLEDDAIQASSSSDGTPPRETDDPNNPFNYFEEMASPSEESRHSRVKNDTIDEEISKFFEDKSSKVVSLFYYPNIKRVYEALNTFVKQERENRIIRF